MDAFSHEPRLCIWQVMIEHRHTNSSWSNSDRKVHQLQKILNQSLNWRPCSDWKHSIINSCSHVNWEWKYKQTKWAMLYPRLWEERLIGVKKIEKNLLRLMFVHYIVHFTNNNELLLLTHLPNWLSIDCNV